MVINVNIVFLLSIKIWKFLLMYKDLSAFLVCDVFCDFDDPAILELATKITKDCSSDKEKAIAVFYLSRDNILYSLGNWNKTATEPLIFCIFNAKYVVFLRVYKIIIYF